MKKSILLALGILWLASCKDKPSVDKQPPIQSPTNVLQSNARIIDNTSVSSFQDSIIVFDNNRLVAPISKNDILIGTPSTLAKYGFMKKVVELKEAGGKL